MDLEFIFGLMVTVLKANLKIASSLAKSLNDLQMVIFMMVTISLGSLTERKFINGQMGINISEILREVKGMDKGYGRILKNEIYEVEYK